MKILITSLFVYISCQVCFAQTQPAIQFTFVPGWGTTSLLKGKVHHTTLPDHGIAVYVFVEEAGGWWNKPLTASPVTPIQPDSSFSTNIVIGGLDQYATKIIAFLIPLTYTPPVVSGGSLPEMLLSFPFVAVCRPHGDRIISWSGLDWIVKKSVGNNLIAIGPGPNIFSDNDSMVWVDNQHKLHLRVARNVNNWHCSEIICKTSQGYNRYNFDVGGRVDLLDPNIIAGIFTWDDCAPYFLPPDNSFREIDFEFSKWGDPGNDNSQYVIQPWSVPGNMNRFNMNLTGTDHSDHSFDWSPDSVTFRSAWGNLFHSWTYTNTGSIPLPGNETVRINFHLLLGKPPSDNEPATLILNSFMMGEGDRTIADEPIKVFPNPFEQGCLIEVFSEHSKEFEAGVFDLRGSLVSRVFSGKLTAGKNRIEWDGKNFTGKPVPSGLYIFYVKDKNGTRYDKIVKM